MPDYAAKARALRAKAADRAVTQQEREALLAKADELEKKHGTGGYFNFTVHAPDDTTVTDRTGRTGQWYRPPSPGFRPAADSEFWTDYMANLLRQQHMWNRTWNSEEEDIVEETYAWQPEDDEDEDAYYREAYDD